MKGKLGSLHKGKQDIGGFLDWRLDMNLIPVGGDPLTYKAGKWKLIANAYWLLDIPDRVTIRLYTPNGYWEGKGIVTSQIKHLWDTLIHENIEIIGEGILEGRE